MCLERVREKGGKVNSKLPQYLWLIAVVLFVCLEIYHFIVGNYFDLIISLLIVIVLLFMIGVFYLIKKFKGAELIQ
jgi:fatty acid desaturase